MRASGVFATSPYKSSFPASVANLNEVTSISAAPAVPAATRVPSAVKTC